MTGFGTYLRFILRRERIISSLWIGLTAFLTLMFAALFPTLMGDDLSKTAMLEMLKSPAMVGMLGPIFGSETYTAAISFAQMMTSWVMITVAVMNIFLVNRHTRVDEEQGRLEMLRSLPVGREVNSAAAITGAFVVNLLMALLTCAAIMAVNFEGCTLGGAMVYAFGISAFGFLMAAVTLLCAQLFSTARGSSGAAFALLGIFYLMRAAGDYSDSLISYISPMGLGLRTFAFHENNLYPIIVQLLEAAALILISFAVCARRDLGEGVIPAKKGKAHAGKNLQSPFGLAWRLTKNQVFVWCVAAFVVGAMYGSMFDKLDSFIESNDFYRQMMLFDEGISGTMTDNFVAMLFLVMTHIALIPVITTAGKLRSEESHGRLEQVFARSVKRHELLCSFVVIAFLLSVATQLCSVFGLYVSGASAGNLELGGLLKSGLCYLPAMWFFAGFGVFLVGVLPRGGMIIWLVYAYSFTVVYLGKMLKLPEFLEKLSPVGVVPKLMIQDFQVLPLLVLTALAVLLTAMGVWRFGERDIA